MHSPFRAGPSASYRQAGSGRTPERIEVPDGGIFPGVTLLSSASGNVVSVDVVVSPNSIDICLPSSSPGRGRSHSRPFIQVPRMEVHPVTLSSTMVALHSQTESGSPSRGRVVSSYPAATLDLVHPETKIKFLEAVTNKRFFEGISQSAGQVISAFREEEAMLHKKRVAAAERMMEDRERKRQNMLERQHHAIQDFSIQNHFNRARQASEDRRQLLHSTEKTFLDSQTESRNKMIAASVDEQRHRFEQLLLRSPATNKAELEDVHSAVARGIQEQRDQQRAWTEQAVSKSVLSSSVAAELRRHDQFERVELLKVKTQNQRSDVLEELRSVLRAKEETKRLEAQLAKQHRSASTATSAQRTLKSSTSPQREAVLEEIRSELRQVGDKRQAEIIRRQREVAEAEAVAQACLIARTESNEISSQMQQLRIREESRLKKELEEKKKRQEEAVQQAEAQRKQQEHDAEVRRQEENACKAEAAAKEEERKRETQEINRNKDTQQVSVPAPQATKTVPPPPPAKKVPPPPPSQVLGKRTPNGLPPIVTSFTNPTNELVAATEGEKKDDDVANPEKRGSSSSEKVKSNDESTTQTTKTTTVASITPWVEKTDEKSGRIYYFNTESRKTTWKKEEVDADLKERQTSTTQVHPVSSADLGDWQEKKDPKTGKTYFYNPKTRKTTWKREEVEADLQKKSEPIETSSSSSASHPVPTSTGTSLGDWQEKTDPKTGKAYFYNPKTKKTTWKREEVVADLKSDGGNESASSSAQNLGDWEEKTDPKTGKKYYYNPKTKKTTWKREDVDADLGKTSSSNASDSLGDWQEKTDPKTGKTYYYNPKTKKTTWKREEALSSAVAATSESDSASLPAGWVEKSDPKSGKNYYYNAALKKTTWKREEVFASTVNSLGDWQEKTDPKTGKTYFYNPKTKKTTWKREEAVADIQE